MESDGIGPGIAPFVRLGPAAAETPLVLAVPHAGRLYPAAIARARAVGWATLRGLEDRYADRLARAAVGEGAVAVVATTARAWIDLNRAETEIGADSSARARAGLGLVPERLGGQALWRAAPDAHAIAGRIAEVHRPYHAALAQALAAAQARHGYAVLIDLHSMPSLARAGRSAARIVIGDRHGTSAAPGVAAAACAAAGVGGLEVARNAPYAGAFTVERHGRPAQGVHALQVEVDRTLYLAPGYDEPSAAVERIARLVASIGWATVTAARPTALAIAAE